MRPLQAPSSRRTHALAALLVSATLCGCYNAEKLVERVRQKAIRTRIEEIDLGSYRVTLPRDTRTGEMTEIDLRLYGESFRYRVNEIESEIKAKGPLVEDRTLRTLRLTTQQELVDPDLEALRGRLLASMNEVLTDAPLSKVGFHHVRFVRH